MRTISRPKIIGAISPPPYAQSSPPKPDAEASQSPPAAHRDDSLATNPSAGLVTEDHPSKRRRGGWGLAGVFAVVAWLAWLACPTAAFAQTNTISISSVAGDDVVTASEKWNGFKITGHTGNQSNIPVVVTFGTETWNTTSTTLIDGNYWWSVSVPGKSSYMTDGDNQTVNAEATFSGGSKLSHSRTFNVDLTLPLVVDAVTGDDVINDGVIHIMGDTGDIGSVRIDLVIGTGSFSNASDLAGEWLHTVLAAENQSYITGSSASLSVTATKTGYERSATVIRTLTKDLVHPSVSYTAPLSLQVGVEITPITPTTSDTDIVSYLFSNPLPGLSLNDVTGVISGTPTNFNASTRRSTVIATDAADNDGTATIDFPPVEAGTLTLNVDDDIAGDDTINESEHRNRFTISGDTGAESGVTVTVDIGGTTLTATSAIAVGATEATWSVSPAASAGYVTESITSVSVTATKLNYTSVTVTRTLTVDLTAPTVSYTAPSILNVGEAIMAMVPTKSEDIFSYAISGGSLPRGLSLNGTTGVISGRPTTGTPNMQTVGVLATDGAGNVDRPQITFPPVDGPEPGVTARRMDPSMPLSVPEGGSAEYTLVLDTQPTHDVTITVKSPAGDEDLTAAPTTLTFTPANWNAERTVTVSAAEDADGMRGIRNLLHNADSDDILYDGISIGSVVAVEADNDQIGVTVWPQVLRMAEGGSAEYTVVLNTQPTDDVTIMVTRDQGGDDDLTVLPDTLIFTKETWDTPQTVTVSAASDADSSDGTATFSHSVSSDEDANYSDDEITIASVTATEDETRPTVEIQTEASAPEGGAFEVTITFSESVLGFTLTDIGVSNGTASNFNRVSSRTYTVTITPEETGEVRVEVGSNVARDGVVNRNRAAEPFVIEVDLTRPEVEITSEATGAVSGAFEVTITFSEAVTGLGQSEITVTNGTVSSFSGSGTSYTVEITPSANGAVTVEIAADVAEDAAGNGNRAVEPFAIEVDLTRPEVEITSEATGAVSGAFEVTITFSEAVTGLGQSEITVTNGTVSSFSGSGTSYTVEITPSANGAVTVEIAADVAEDAAGNGNRAVEPFAIEVDLTRPEVEITSEATGAVSGAFEVTITFSEAVTGLGQSEITVTNGTVSSFSGSGTSYTVEITPSANGAVTVEIAADVAEDAAGNGNRAVEPFAIEVDLTRPEVEITSEATGAVSDAFEVTITFSEAVTGLGQSEITVTNGTVSSFSGSGTSYTVEITRSANGAVTVEIAADVAEDAAGNGNRAVEPFEVEAKLVVSYQEEDYTATEGGGAVTVTVNLIQGWDEELAIPIRVTRPDATEVADYTLDGLEDWDAREGTGRLTFPAEETEQTFTIEANHDGDGDDETVELGFGELPEIVLAGEPAVATVTLEDKGLVELKVSFGQAEYQIREGQQADIEVTVSPGTDRRVEVPLVVALQGGTTPEDYSGVPALVVFEEGESEGTISVEILADEVNDPGEGIVLSFGELPEAVSGGEISQTTVNFRQQRTAEQFSQTLDVTLAVMARTMGESAQTAIEGRFERHRQWSRLGAAGAAVPTAQPGSDNSAAALGPGESERMGSESLEGSGRRRAEGPVVPSAGGAAGAPAAMGSGGESGDRESGVQGAWLRNVSLGGLAGLFGHGQGDAGVSTGSGMGPSGTGPTVGLGGRPGYGQNRFQGTGTRSSSLRSGSAPFSGRRHRELNLAGVSLELPLAGQQKGTSGSWVPALWGQGDLQHFNGNLTRHEMSYRGGLKAAHVGLDLYANDKVLAGLSFMRSWGNTDYSDDGIDGVLRSRMNTFHPYLYWQPAERVSVWGMGGLGRGQVDVNEPGRSHDFEADFRMFSGGVRSVLSRRGSNELGLRADAFWAQLGTEASEDIAKVRGEAHRARLMLEWVHTKQLSVGRSLSLKAEAGGRFDGGDAERGRGAETGFRLGYLDASSGLDVALHGRVLVVHESDYRDWGLGVQASWDPGEKQRGFRVSVTSTRGQDGGGRTTLWNNANMVTRPVGMDAMGGMGSQSRMESEVAYGGMKALGLPGLLTPYSRLRWAGQGRELAWGTAWSLPPRSQLALPLMLEMEAMRRENRTGTADLAVLVRMSIPF